MSSSDPDSTLDYICRRFPDARKGYLYGDGDDDDEIVIRDFQSLGLVGNKSKLTKQIDKENVTKIASSQHDVDTIVRPLQELTPNVPSDTASGNLQMPSSATLPKPVDKILKVVRNPRFSNISDAASVHNSPLANDSLASEASLVGPVDFNNTHDEMLLYEKFGDNYFEVVQQMSPADRKALKLIQASEVPKPVHELVSDCDSSYSGVCADSPQIFDIQSPENRRDMVQMLEEDLLLALGEGNITDAEINDEKSTEVHLPDVVVHAVNSDEAGDKSSEVAPNSASSPTQPQFTKSGVALSPLKEVKSRYGQPSPMRSPQHTGPLNLSPIKPTARPGLKTPQPVKMSSSCTSASLADRRHLKTSSGGFQARPMSGLKLPSCRAISQGAATSKLPVSSHGTWNPKSQASGTSLTTTPKTTTSSYLKPTSASKHRSQPKRHPVTNAILDITVCARHNHASSTPSSANANAKSSAKSSNTPSGAARYHMAGSLSRHNTPHFRHQ